MIHQKQIQKFRVSFFLNSGLRGLFTGFAICFITWGMAAGVCIAQEESSPSGQMSRVSDSENAPGISEPLQKTDDEEAPEAFLPPNSATPERSPDPGEIEAEYLPSEPETDTELSRSADDDIPAPIPDILIPFDSEGETEYSIVVEKETQQLFLYAYDGTFREVHRLKCSTGKSLGPKAVSGDSKTPEGVYFFIKIHEKKELAPIYGIRAFPTDYPNVLDRIAGRTGNAIWLHGTNKALKDRDSNGCVVLEDENVEKLTPHIRLNRTPIIIVDRLSYASDEAKLEAKNAISALVSDWRNALETGTYHQYLSHYDPEYLPDISWWMEWYQIRKEAEASQQPLSVDLKNVLIVRHKKVYAVLFDQSVSLSGKEASAGIRKIFLKHEDDRFKIIADAYQGVPETRKKENPLILAFHDLRTVPDPKDEREIAGILDEWLKAWSSKDIERYGGHYASDFQSQGMNRTSWLNHKKRLNQKYAYIRVSKKGLTVRKSQERRIVSFVQSYESNAFKATGVKQLVLKREGGQWKIYRETWKKM
ncbi:MAG: hypothetical protein B6245_06090 [Desulfobacteraceae bacterium 4572_88]|nr:MAG: hypothetical protein B6245_06090 [Desulfobacteraceae bacterium 4572_88]